MKKTILILPMFLCLFSCCLISGNKKTSYKTPEPTFDANYFVSDEDIDTLAEPVFPADACSLTPELEEAMNLITVKEYISYQSYGEYGSEDEWGVFTVPTIMIRKYNNPAATREEDENEIMVTRPCINNYFVTIVKINKNGKESTAARGFIIKGIKTTECDETDYWGPAYILLVKPAKGSIEMNGLTDELSEFAKNSLK